jgi:hypothetical protein
MATAALKFDPIAISVGFMKTERYLFPATGERHIDVGSNLCGEPDLFRTPKGATELTIQARMCGDYYAMIDGPQMRCASVCAPTLKGAVTALFEQASS